MVMFYLPTFCLYSLITQWNCSYMFNIVFGDVNYLEIINSNRECVGVICKYHIILHMRLNTLLVFVDTHKTSFFWVCASIEWNMEHSAFPFQAMSDCSDYIYNYAMCSPSTYLLLHVSDCVLSLANMASKT